jgi:hypothetical protein
MKIGFTAPGCGQNADLDWPTRGEGRWSLNWMHILREEGHDIHQILNGQPKNGQLDWFLNAEWGPPDCCFSGEVDFLNHAHLRYGPIKDESWFKAMEAGYPNVNCLRDGTGAITFGYKGNYYNSLSAWAKAERPYNIGLMPIPFSSSMFTETIPTPFTRSSIAWMSKEVFHSAQFERGTPTPDIGLVFLRALEKFSRKVDFKLYFIMTGAEQFPEEAEQLLSKMNVKKVPLLPFGTLLKLMSTVKINLGVAGMASSTIDSLFMKAVPLGHNNGFMTETIRTEFPEGVLPGALQTTEENVYNLLEALWFDKKFYKSVGDCYQEEFSVHHKDNALRWFYSFVDSVK